LSKNPPEDTSFRTSLSLNSPPPYVILESLQALNHKVENLALEQENYETPVQFVEELEKYDKHAIHNIVAFTKTYLGAEEHPDSGTQRYRNIRNIQRYNYRGKISEEVGDIRLIKIEKSYVIIKKPVTVNLLTIKTTITKKDGSKYVTEHCDLFPLPKLKHIVYGEEQHFQDYRKPTPMVSNNKFWDHHQEPDFYIKQNYPVFKRQFKKVLRELAKDNPDVKLNILEIGAEPYFVKCLMEDFSAFIKSYSVTNTNKQAAARLEELDEVILYPWDFTTNEGREHIGDKKFDVVIFNGIITNNVLTWDIAYVSISLGA